MAAVEALMTTIANRSAAPISTRDLPERDAFLWDLAALVGSLRAAKAVGAVTSLEQLGRRLERRAAALGFGAIAASAAKLEHACGAANPVVLSAAIEELARHTARRFVAPSTPR